MPKGIAQTKWMGAEPKMDNSNQVMDKWGSIINQKQLKYQNKLGAHSEKDISNQQWISMQQRNQSAT